MNYYAEYTSKSCKPKSKRLRFPVGQVRRLKVCSGKTEQAENKQLSLDLSENLGHRANHCFKKVKTQTCGYSQLSRAKTCFIDRNLPENEK